MTPGECYGCIRTDVVLKKRVMRTHPGRPTFEAEICDECMVHIDGQVARLMKANGIMARRVAVAAGRMGGEPE